MRYFIATLILELYVIERLVNDSLSESINLYLRTAQRRPLKIAFSVEILPEERKRARGIVYPRQGFPPRHALP